MSASSPIIYAWARAALGVDAATVTDDQLAMFASSEEGRIKAAYPCILTAGTLNLSGSDLDSYYEAAGYRTAARFYKNPGAKDLQAKLTQVKVGPVTEVYGDTAAKTFPEDCLAEAGRAMLQIACISASSPRNRPRTAATGRRRQEGQPWTVLQEAFGKDDHDGHRIDVLEQLSE